MKFVESSDEFVRRQITYRYNNMKSKLNIMHAKLADVNSLVSCGEYSKSIIPGISTQDTIEIRTNTLFCDLCVAA